MMNLQDFQVRQNAIHRLWEERDSWGDSQASSIQNIEGGALSDVINLLLNKIYCLGKHHLEAAWEDEVVQGQPHLAEHEGAVSKGATLSFLGSVKLLFCNRWLSIRLTATAFLGKKFARFVKDLALRLTWYFIAEDIAQACNFVMCNLQRPLRRGKMRAVRRKAVAILLL